MGQWNITRLMNDDSLKCKLQSDIITAAINKLLKSKILLDEDEELINTHVELITAHNKDATKRFEDYHTFTQSLCWKLNVFTDLTMRDNLISAVCVVPQALMEVWLFYVCRQFRSYGKQFEELIRLSHENLLLVVQIERYFQERELFLSEYKSKVDNDDLYKLLEAPEQKFKSAVVNRLFKTVCFLQEEIKNSTSVHEEVFEMYDTISHIELNNLMASSEDALAECIKDMKYLYMLLISNFWGSFVLELIFNISKCEVFYKSMDTSCRVRDVLKANYEDIRKDYVDIRKASSCKRNEDKKVRPVSNRANVVRVKKIHDIQIFFKVGSDMAHTLENVISDNEKFELQISALIDHLKKASIQLNALEYIRPRSVPNEVVNDKAGKNIQPNFVEDPELKTIRFDEPDSEGSDEEYECIVHDDEPREVGRVDEYDDVVARKSDYVQMMQELGTALAMVRERRAAKKGSAHPVPAPRSSTIKDSQEPLPAPRTKRQKEEPTIGQCTPESNHNGRMNETEDVRNVPNRIPIPPPPMPESYSDPIGGTSNTIVDSTPIENHLPPMGSFTSGLFFAQQVAWEARKRNVVEEQFGCSGEGEEENGNDEENKDLLINSSRDPNNS